MNILIPITKVATEKMSSYPHSMAETKNPISEKKSN